MAKHDIEENEFGAQEADSHDDLKGINDPNIVSEYFVPSPIDPEDLDSIKPRRPFVGLNREEFNKALEKIGQQPSDEIIEQKVEKQADSHDDLEHTNDPNIVSEYFVPSPIDPEDLVFEKKTRPFVGLNREEFNKGLEKIFGTEKAFERKKDK